MAVDKNKITAEATKLVQKGQFDKAIKAYERILQDDPKDVRVLLKVGELQQKKGDNAGAAGTFNRVADAYGEQGFFLKAVAVYKQIIKLTPDDVRVNERLAGLYQQLGLMSDAMGQLQVVAAAYEKAVEAKQIEEQKAEQKRYEPGDTAKFQVRMPFREAWSAISIWPSSSAQSSAAAHCAAASGAIVYSMGSELRLTPVIGLRPVLALPWWYQL